MDTIKKERFVISLTYEMEVNIDTGEILGTKLVNREVLNSDLKASKKPKLEVPETEEPMLILEDNKFRLTSSAVALMNISNDSKIVIRYEDSLKGPIPVIGANTAFGINSGNRLTKSNTVACRGNNHDELAKYGNEFTLVPHPDKPGIFKLCSTVPVDTKEDVKEDTKEDEVLKMTDDLDLDKLIDSEDENIKTVDSNFFQL